MKTSLILLCALLGCVVSQAPVISETFLADLTVHIQNGTHQFFGRGVEVRDQPAGKAVVQYIFHDEGHVENVYVLERYDLGEQYTVSRGEKCLNTKLTNQTMPLQWAWLKNPNTKLVGHERINGVNASVWELQIGYATISVAVSGDIPLVFRRNGNDRNLTVIYERFDGKTPIDAKGRYFDVPGQCKSSLVRVAPSASCVTGASIVERGDVWVKANIPYSQSRTHDGYRTDCSGFVSMAWELSKPGLVTQTLASVSKPIKKAELKPGDIILNKAEHVVLFVKWTDKSETHYIGYEEANTKEGTISSKIPYPYWYETSLFLPYRYDKLC